jgi:hypothetical protein
MTGILHHSINGYSTPTANRLEQRRMLNCISSPRLGVDICIPNVPSCYDSGYLLDWVKNKAPLLEVEILPLVIQHQPVFLLDSYSKKPICFMRYEDRGPSDIITAWDWRVEWQRKGKGPKTEVAVLKKLVSFEYGDVVRKYETILNRQRTRQLFVPLV